MGLNQVLQWSRECLNARRDKHIWIFARKRESREMQSLVTYADDARYKVKSSED